MMIKVFCTRRVVLGLTLIGALVGPVGQGEEQRCPVGFIEGRGGCVFKIHKEKIFDGKLLRKGWPPLVLRGRPEQINARTELGRLLFFDPILSGDNTMSCGHCHDPAAAMADGQRLALGIKAKRAGKSREGGVILRRNTPGIYSVGFESSILWDGRAASLEHQAIFPFLNKEELNQRLEEVIAEIRAIPGYELLFSKAFPVGLSKSDSQVTFENLAAALATFQRTLLSTNSRFDQFSQGKKNALDEEERLGMKVFFSEKTKCVNCHPPPTFSRPGVFVLGIPRLEGDDVDLGAYEQNPRRDLKGAFKVPTLRNISLTAPYMHNGALASLEEVVTFFENGGGGATDGEWSSSDLAIQPFRLTPTERQALIKFLKSLTDESARPSVPDRVPSGLPVME